MPNQVLPEITCTPTRAFLTVRRHVDLLRVSSASCPRAAAPRP
ncbi:putative leader peptide [Frankia sp. Mgl5]